MVRLHQIHLQFTAPSEADLGIRRLLCLGDVVCDMDVVSQLNADLDNVQAHLDDVLASDQIVPGAYIAFESALQEQKGVLKSALCGDGF